MNDLRDNEIFDHLRPCDGTVLFFGLRHAPDNREQVLFVANMEGAPRDVAPLELPIPNLPEDGWKLALATPRMEEARATQPVTLHDSQGLVFVRKSSAD
jgi:hypothetical protein